MLCLMTGVLLATANPSLAWPPLADSTRTTRAVALNSSTDGSRSLSEATNRTSEPSGGHSPAQMNSPLVETSRVSPFPKWLMCWPFFQMKFMGTSSGNRLCSLLSIATPKMPNSRIKFVARSACGFALCSSFWVAREFCYPACAEFSALTQRSCCVPESKLARIETQVAEPPP